MKTQIVFICFFLSAFQSFTQNYSHYYQGINKAKMALVEGDLEAAVSNYHKTFESFEFAFARDCYNALEVSSNLKDYQMMDYFLKRCLKQGVEFEFLQGKSMLDTYKETDFWPEMLLVKDSLRIIYTNNVNWEIRAEINTMFTEDQEIRDLVDKNRFNIFKLKKLNKQFEETDRKLVNRLIEITKAHGFPGEKLIGIDTKRMHDKIDTNRLTTGMPIVIFIHHFSQPNESYNHVLIDEIQKGNLLNEHYATISDFQYTYGGKKQDNTLCYSQKFAPKLDVETIDENRKNIHLMSVSDTYKLQSSKLITPFWVNLY